MALPFSSVSLSKAICSLELRLAPYHTMASFTLPKNFLSGSGPEIRKEEVNFKNTSLPEYGGLYTTVLDNAFSKSECDMLIRAVEARTNGTWEQAMVNVGMGEQKLMTNVRKCGRVIWDDQILVEKIWSRVKAVVPEIEDIKEKPEVTGRGPAKRKETWKFSRLNERARFLKYGKGDYFNRESKASLQCTFYNTMDSSNVYQPTWTAHSKHQMVQRCRSTPSISTLTNHHPTQKPGHSKEEQQPSTVMICIGRSR